MPPLSDLLLAPTAVKALLVIPASLLLFTAIWHIVYYFNPTITINRSVAWHRAFNFLAVTVCTGLSTKAQFNPQEDLRGVPFFQIVPVLTCSASQVLLIVIIFNYRWPNFSSKVYYYCCRIQCNGFDTHSFTPSLYFPLRLPPSPHWCVLHTRWSTLAMGCWNYWFMYHSTTIMRFRLLSAEALQHPIP